MRIRFALPAILAGLLVSAPLWAQAEHSIDLSGTWKFNKGDNKTWSTPEFADTLWKDVTVPGSWQSQGLPEYTGPAWYRKHVTVPSEWERNTVVKEGKILRMDLGRIADAYEVYWNGTLIAQGGKFPPAFAAAPTTAVHAGVPVDKTSFTGDNLLAVRVYDKAAPGGILEGPLALREPTYADFIDVDVAGKDNKVEFARQEGLPIDVIVMNTGPADWQKGTVKVSLYDGGGKLLTTMPLMIDVGAGKQTRTTIELKEADLNPGLYTIQADVQMGGQTLRTAARTFVYFPGGIRTEAFKTADQATAFQAKLDAFWKVTIAALKNTPIGGSSTLSEAMSTPKVRVYKVSFNALKGQTIYGWLSVPADASKSPGIVIMPGYGNGPVEPANYLAEAGFATLAINVHGSDVDAKTYPSETESYTAGGFADPNTFVMRGMVSAGLRALDYLAQRPEVDASRLGVLGMSQGGGLAVDVAALDPRVKTVVASSPIGDFQRMFAQARRNPASPMLESMDASTKAQLFSTMNYFDPALLASRLKVPTLITVGMADPVVPPETAYAVKNAIPTGVFVSINADEASGHAVTEAQRDAIVKWLRKFLVG